MKAVIGLLLAVCVATAVGQTTSAAECYDSATATFEAENPTCATLYARARFNSQTDIIADFCESSCAVTANNIYNNACNFPVSQSFCSRPMNSEDYCTESSNIQAIGTAISQLLNGACLDRNCNNPDCNATVQALSCCVNTLGDYFEGTIGVNIIGNGLLPDGCMVPQCPTATFGGAPSLVVMPVTIFTAILAALVAAF